MYYELINEVWKPNNKKLVFFQSGIEVEIPDTDPVEYEVPPPATYPINRVPDDFWNAERMPAAQVPVYDAATHKLVGPQDLKNGTVGYVVVELTDEEIATNLDSDRESKVMQVANSACQLIDSQIDPAGMFLVRDLTAVGSQKAIETEEWINGVYMEAEYRKGLIYADMWPDDQDMNDFSSFGEKPHTIAQLMASV